MFCHGTWIVQCMLLNYVNYWYLNCCLCMSNFSFPGKNVIATNYVDEQKGKSFIIKTQCFDITLIDCSKNKNEKRCVMHCAFILLNSVEDYQTADVYMQD